MARLPRSPPSSLPLQQGDLDGLCGPYAIVNAIRYLCPEMDAALSEALFHKLLRALPDCVDDPFAVHWRGLHPKPLRVLLEVAVRFVRKGFGVGLDVERLPKDLRKHPTLDRLWDELSCNVGWTTVALLGFDDGDDGHWTVVTSLTTHTMQLFDSGKRSVITRKACVVAPGTARYVIDVDSIVLVTR